MWKEDPNLSLQDPENVKPTGICPGDAFFSYSYNIWITSGFVHTGEERLAPKFQDTFTFPVGASTAMFDSNYCLTLPDSIRQCAQFCNPRTTLPELNPYWINRYNEGLKREAAADTLSDSLLAAKSCKQRQLGDQLNAQSSEIQKHQGKAFTGENNYFLHIVTPSNYFPLAGSTLRDLFTEEFTDINTSLDYDGKSAPIPVDADIDGSSSDITGPGIRKRAEKLRAREF